MDGTHRWRVVLNGDRDILAKLAEWFSEPELQVSLQGDEYHLTSQAMDELPELKQVSEFAAARIVLLDCYASFVRHGATPLSVSATIEVAGGEQKRWAHITASITSSIGIGLQSGPDPIRDATLATTTTQGWSRIIAEDPRARRVLGYWLRYVERGNQEPCLAMRRVLEAVAEHWGGSRRSGKNWENTIRSQGWATEEEAKGLSELVHNKRGSGPQALHAYEGDPIKYEMTLGEADVLVRRIMMQYLAGLAKLH